jgi:hypothetical protein
MELNINKLDEVWTSDGKKLGLAQNLFHRLDDINPDLQLYATYLVVENYEFGEVFYIPTDFIAEPQEDSQGVTLLLARDQILQRTLFRMPNFVASDQARKESLGGA